MASVHDRLNQQLADIMAQQKVSARSPGTNAGGGPPAHLPMMATVVQQMSGTQPSSAPGIPGLSSNESAQGSGVGSLMSNPLMPYQLGQKGGSKMMGMRQLQGGSFESHTAMSSLPAMPFGNRHSLGGDPSNCPPSLPSLQSMQVPSPNRQISPSRGGHHSPEDMSGPFMMGPDRGQTEEPHAFIMAGADSGGVRGSDSRVMMGLASDNGHMLPSDSGNMLGAETPGRSGTPNGGRQSTPHSGMMQTPHSGMMQSTPHSGMMQTPHSGMMQNSPIPNAPGSALQRPTPAQLSVPAPKVRPKSAYDFFLADYKLIWKREHQDKAMDMKEIRKEARVKWGGLPMDDKQVFENKAAEFNSAKMLEMQRQVVGGVEGNVSAMEGGQPEPTPRAPGTEEKLPLQHDKLLNDDVPRRLGCVQANIEAERLALDGPEDPESSQNIPVRHFDRRSFDRWVVVQKRAWQQSRESRWQSGVPMRSDLAPSRISRRATAGQRKQSLDELEYENRRLYPRPAKRSRPEEEGDGRPKRVRGTEAELNKVIDTWVQCDKCDKWRRVAVALPEGEPWDCSMCKDPTYNSCAAPQEMTDDEIDRVAGGVAEKGLYSRRQRQVGKPLKYTQEWGLTAGASSSRQSDKVLGFDARQRLAVERFVEGFGVPEDWDLARTLGGARELARKSSREMEVYGQLMLQHLATDAPEVGGVNGAARVSGQIAVAYLLRKKLQEVDRLASDASSEACELFIKESFQEEAGLKQGRCRTWGALQDVMVLRAIVKYGRSAWKKVCLDIPSGLALALLHHFGIPLLRSRAPSKELCALLPCAASPSHPAVGWLHRMMEQTAEPLPETTPLTAAQAFASGKPVFAKDVKGQSVFSQGLLVRPQAEAKAKHSPALPASKSPALPSSRHKGRRSSVVTDSGADAEAAELQENEGKGGNEGEGNGKGGKAPKDQKEAPLRWTSEEITAMLQGVARHGSNWKDIKGDEELAPMLTKRNNIKMKDKWRNLQSQLDAENLAALGAEDGRPPGKQHHNRMAELLLEKFGYRQCVEGMQPGATGQQGEAQPTKQEG